MWDIINFHKFGYTVWMVIFMFYWTLLLQKCGLFKCIYSAFLNVLLHLVLPSNISGSPGFQFHLISSLGWSVHCYNPAPSHLLGLWNQSVILKAALSQRLHSRCQDGAVSEEWFDGHIWGHHISKREDSHHEFQMVM